MKNIHKLYPFLLLFALLSVISCSPEKTEIWYEKNGGGKIEVTLDMGEMATGIMQSMDENGGDKPPKDPWANEENIDSTTNFYTMMPDSVKETLSNPDMLKRFNLNMKVDTKKEYAKMKMTVDYDSAEQLEEILKAIKEAQSKNKSGKMAAADGGDTDLSAMFEGYNIDLKNGIIRLDAMDMSDMKDDPEFGEMLQMLENPEASEDPEMAMMMEMMFGGDMETVIHAPGKILFTNDRKAKIDGNTVTFTDNILEMMKT